MLVNMFSEITIFGKKTHPLTTFIYVPRMWSLYRHWPFSLVTRDRSGVCAPFFFRGGGGVSSAIYPPCSKKKKHIIYVINRILNWEKYS